MIVDTNTIEDAGFDKFLRRGMIKTQPYYGNVNKRVPIWDLLGGEMAADSVINVGPNIKIDGKNKQIVINDGADDRILIGFDQGGF